MSLFQVFEIISSRIFGSVESSGVLFRCRKTIGGSHLKLEGKLFSSLSFFSLPSGISTSDWSISCFSCCLVTSFANSLMSTFPPVLCHTSSMTLYAIRLMPTMLIIIGTYPTRKAFVMIEWPAEWPNSLPRFWKNPLLSGANMFNTGFTLSPYPYILMVI